METEALCCPKCLNHYDQNERVPRILIICGHTFCGSCANDLCKNGVQIQCPLDDKTIALDGKEPFLPNVALLKFIALRSSEEICKVHDKKMKILCLQDKCKVCNYCVQYGDHRGHKTKLIKDAKNEANSVIKNLETALSDMESHRTQVINSVEDQKRSLVDLIQTKFTDIREALNAEEAQLLAELESFFELEKMGMAEILGEASYMKRVITEKIENAKSAMDGSKWFGGWDDLPLTSYKLVHDLVNRHSIDLQSKFRELSSHFGTSLESRKPTLRLTFPVDELKAKTTALATKANNSLRAGENLTGSNNLSLIKVSQEGSDLDITIRASATPDKTFDVIEVESPQIKNVSAVKVDLGEGKLTEEAVLQILNLWKGLEKVACLKIHYLKEGTIAESLDSLAFLLSQVNKIQALDLRLNAPDLDDQKLGTLVSQIQPIYNSLKTIILDFSHTAITGSSLEPLFTGGSEGLPNNLEHFELSLSHTKITEESLVKVLSLNMSGLKAFKLDVTNTEFSEIGNEALSQAVSSMKGVQHLEIHMNTKNVSDLGLLQLFNKELPTVKCLILHFNNTRVSDEILKAFSKIVLPSTRVLEHLELYFAATAVTDLSVHLLLACQLYALKTFKLNLDRCKITDLSLETFSLHNLQHMKLLEHLELDLSSTPVTDKGVISMFSNGFPNVKVFVVKLPGTKITDKCIDHFIQFTSKTMKSWKQVTIDTARTFATKQIK